jgi:hypothetical protein
MRVDVAAERIDEEAHATAVVRGLAAALPSLGWRVGFL